MESLLDATYVINMDSDTDRLEEFDHMMESSKWNYERFSAINGKKLMGSWNNISNLEHLEHMRILFDMKKRYVSRVTWLSHGEIGCLLSHVSLWQEVANNPSKHRIAIFEDDARTHADGNTVRQLLIDFYAYLSLNNIDEPDILYLGKSLDNCIDYEKVYGNIYRSQHPLCLHAYIITKSGAQKLLNRAPFVLAIDMVPIKAIADKVLNVMTFHPSLYFQDIFGTTSNLRQLKAGINNTTECLVFQQHVTHDTWYYLFMVFIALIAAITLFTIFIFIRPWNNSLK